MPDQNTGNDDFGEEELWEFDQKVYRMEIWGARIVGFIFGMAVMFVLTLLF